MCKCTGQSLSAHMHTWARGEKRFKCTHSLCGISERARPVLCESKGNPRASREIRAQAGSFELAHYINLLSRYKNALSTFGSKITPYSTTPQGAFGERRGALEAIFLKGGRWAVLGGRLVTVSLHKRCMSWNLQKKMVCHILTPSLHWMHQSTLSVTICQLVCSANTFEKERKCVRNRTRHPLTVALALIYWMTDYNGIHVLWHNVLRRSRPE